MTRPIVAAFCFPSWHRDRRLDERKGAGWTEWELLAAARPRFPGHRILRPAWGRYDEADPLWAAREIDCAADHGVDAFIYDWYWYEDGPFLHRALEEGFQRAPNRARMRYALMWANHDWVELFPAPPVRERAMVQPGAVSAEGFARQVEHLIERHFSDPCYLRIDGRPWFSIYEIGRFIAGLGSVDAARSALTEMRKRCERAGLGGVHLNLIAWGFNVLPGETQVDHALLARELGADSLTSYCWVHHHPLWEGPFPTQPYDDAFASNRRAWAELRQRFAPLPYHPNVSVGWDPSPRTDQDAPFADHGYPWTPALVGNTPERVGAALRFARTFAESGGAAQPMVTLYAWNEWTEGAALLPSEEHGDALLRQILAVFGPAADQRAAGTGST
jgi:hypothetical protein